MGQVLYKLFFHVIHDSDFILFDVTQVLVSQRLYLIDWK